MHQLFILYTHNRNIVAYNCGLDKLINWSAAVLWSCEAGYITVYDKIMIENQKRKNVEM